jgi:hypothetical protein
LKDKLRDNVSEFTLRGASFVLHGLYFIESRKLKNCEVDVAYRVMIVPLFLTIPQIVQTLSRATDTRTEITP